MAKRYHILLLLIFPFTLKAQIGVQELKCNGFIDTYHAVRSEEPHDYLSSRTRFRGEVKAKQGYSSLFASFNLNHNGLLPDLSGFELREAYLDYTTNHWSMRAGRQLIIWGAADGVRITDLISPMDYTEFLARDYDDIRMPVDALKFRYFNNTVKVELVFVPIFTSFIIPTDPKNPWAIIPPNSPTAVKRMEEKRPKNTFSNSEIGGRLTLNLPGVDLSLAALHTWDKMAVMNNTFVNDTLFITPEYHRMTFLGGDFSKPLGQCVFRGEVAFNYNKHFAYKEPNKGLAKKNTSNYLLAIDWYPAGEWTLMAQYSNEIIFDYTPEINRKKNTSLVTVNISKKIMNSTLQISDFTYYDLDNQGFFSRFAIDYSLSDPIHLITGYDWFHGEEGLFGFYNKNSEIWLKAKYSF